MKINVLTVKYCMQLCWICSTAGVLFSLQAQDIDTGAFGTAGIRYSLIGSGNNKYVHCAVMFIVEYLHGL